MSSTFITLMDPTPVRVAVRDKVTIVQVGDACIHLHDAALAERLADAFTVAAEHLSRGPALDLAGEVSS